MKNKNIEDVNEEEQKNNLTFFTSSGEVGDDARPQ